MSKIYDINNENLQILPQHKTIKSDKNMFQNIFEKVIETNETNSENVSASVPALGEIRSLIFPKIEDVSAKNTITDKTNKLLDLLESYAKDLGNPNKNLKELEPLISGIKENAQTLMKEADEKLSDNPELKNIAMECAQAANLEYIKFQRGDYI